LSRDEQRSLKSSTTRDPSVVGRVVLSLPQPRLDPRQQLEREGSLGFGPMGEDSKQGPGSRILSHPVPHQPAPRERGTG